jgi:hypothetical protein
MIKKEEVEEVNTFIQIHTVHQSFKHKFKHQKHRHHHHHHHHHNNNNNNNDSNNKNNKKQQQ